MEKRPENRMLDSKEACEEFRNRYFDSAFKAAFSITGTYSDAEALTRRLFEDMEARFENVELPSAPELYILSHINLLYAKGGVAYRRKPQSAPAKSTGAATPPEAKAPAKSQPAKAPTVGVDTVASVPQGAPMGQVYYIQQPVLLQTTPITLTAITPQMADKPESPAAPPAAEPAPAPAPEPVERDGAGNTKEQYDPKLTELWRPGSEPERGVAQPERAAAVGEASRPGGAEDGGAEDEAPEEDERSIPLTIVNTVLLLGLLCSLVFASVQMGLLRLFT